MNKKLKLLQRSKMLKTLEVEKVKHDLSKIDNSTITMVAYDDASNKFLIGDNSGDLYVATPEYLNSLNVNATTDISTILAQLDKSSIAEHFNKLTVQEAKEMFGDRYVYYWSANNKIYGVKQGLIERIDEGPDAAKAIELWNREENIFSNDRGVNELTEIKFSTELRPAFLTFSAEALPVYRREQKLKIHDPVKIADDMNKNLQTQDYTPSGSHYGYDMKDSNAVMKAYLGTDDLVIINNNDRRKVVDIDPPTTDPDNDDVTYENNTPFNHNYSMTWSTIRSGRLFEEFNDEANDNNSNFVGMTRHEELEVSFVAANNARAANNLSDDEDVDIHVQSSGAYANVPNLGDAYTTYLETDKFGDKQLYNDGTVANSIKNITLWSLDEINGTNCKVTRRVYNTITGEVKNAERHYDGVIGFTITNIKDKTARIRRVISVPVLKGAICDFDKFEFKHDETGKAISMDVPSEYVDGIVEYSLDTSIYNQGTNGSSAYGMRKIFVQSGLTKVFLDSVAITGVANFKVYDLAANATSANISRTTSVKFVNTDGTEYNYTTSDNTIGTGTVSHTVSTTPTGVSGSNHTTTHTRTIRYTSGATSVTVAEDYDYPSVSYEIFTLSSGKTTATLKGSSVGSFKTYSKGSKQTSTYNVTQSRHISVESAQIRYVRNAESYTTSGKTCSQTLYADYTYNSVKISKSITKSAKIDHFIYNLTANATTATIKRTFQPTFYTISSGVESKTATYKNDTVLIDTDKTAIVSYSVADRVTSVGTNVHNATHTRTVTYTQNNVNVIVDTSTYEAPITYTLYTLSAGATSATFKGSSKGKFTTITNGTNNSSTYYEQGQSNHITVTTTNMSYSNSSITYTSATNVKCTRTLSLDYAVNGVKVSINLTAVGNVTHHLCSVNDYNSASITRKYTPTFYTYVNGSKTATVFKNETISIDTITTGVSISHTVGTSVSKVEGANHYALHTRSIKYTVSNIVFDIDTESSYGNITYTWKDLNAISGGVPTTTATWYGSSTGSFSKWANGSKVANSTYSVTKSNHMTVTANLSTVNEVQTYTSASQQCKLVLTGTYTASVNNVSAAKKLNKQALANITHTLYGITANATKATLKLVYTPSIKAMANGVDLNTYYTNIARTISTDTKSDDITYGTLAAAYTGTGTAIKRTVKYTKDGITLTIFSDDSSNSKSYALTSHTGTTAKFKNTITATWYNYSAGTKQSTVHTTKTATSSEATANVSYSSLKWNGSSGSVTVSATYGGETIASVAGTVSNSPYFADVDYSKKTVKVHMKLNIKGTLKSGTGCSEYSTTYDAASTNAPNFSHLLKRTDVDENGSCTVTPVMTAAANFTFNKVGESGTYSTSYRTYSANPMSCAITLDGMSISSVTTGAVATINYVSYKGLPLYDNDAGSTYSYHGETTTGSVSDVVLSTSLLSPSCVSSGWWIFGSHACFSRINVTVKSSGTWHKISWSGSCGDTHKQTSEAQRYISVGGSMYNWNYFYYTQWFSVTYGNVTKQYRYKSSTRYDYGQSQPSGGTALCNYATASGTSIQFP